MTQLFVKYDADKSGTIEVKEIKDALAKEGIHYIIDNKQRCTCPMKWFQN
jgi:hypothetical protein